MPREHVQGRAKGSLCSVNDLQGPMLAGKHGCTSERYAGCKVL